MIAADRYRIERRIARGGMAEVYEAVAVGAEGFERRVALKRVLPEFEQDASFKRMFLDEARIAGRLSHANVVSVLDYGVLDGRPFQVLEYVDGLDAGKLARLGRERDAVIPTEVALHIVAEVARGLAHAHRATDGSGRGLGIVHRDVSPSNVLVSLDAEVKLTDFGIALARDREERTRTGQIKGKLKYMSPEQMMGGELDGRTDLFSLGCTLHALLVGRTPLSEERAVAVLLQGEPLPIHPGLDDDVRAIVARALAPDRVDRYGDADEMAAALQDAIQRRGGDGRARLRAWLSTLEIGSGTRRAAAPGRLDVEVVASSGGGDRTFSASGALDAAPTAPTVSRSERTASEPVVVPVSRAWMGWVVALGVAATAGAAAILYAERAGPSPDALEAVGAARLAADAGAAEAAPAGDAVEPPVADAGEPARDAGRAPAATSVRGRRRSEAVTPPEVEPAGVMGRVWIGAPDRDLDGAAIWIDGRSTGHEVPYTLRLPVGAHRLEVRAADGRRLGPYRFELTREHSVRRLRFALPD